MRLPRFRLRTLMIAVAVVGLALGGTAWALRMAHLSKVYRQMAAEAAYGEAFVREELRKQEYYAAGMREVTDKDDSVNLRQKEVAAGISALAEYLALKKVKYERAAARPWRPVPPDPPQPRFPLGGAPDF